MPSKVSANKSDIAAFVLPVFLDGGAQSIDWLEQAVGSVLKQSDPNWRLVMVNDQSPHPGTISTLKRLQAKDKRIHVITAKSNGGAGVARNLGVQWAHKNGFPYILYLDSDDVSHPSRVEVVRSIMANDPEVDVVYSTITIIDENNNEVPMEKLSGSIQEIIECHDNPPQGEKAWIDIGTRTGYANQTSSTAVRADLAIKQPFPEERAVEDAHAWFRYGAEGKKFVFAPDIPTKYRIPQTASDSAMRDRMGGVDAYYTKQCEVERDGFAKAIDIAIGNGAITNSEKDRLMAGYHVRMGESMRRINQLDLAKKEIEQAHAISPQFAKEWIEMHGYDWARQ